jgi:hypothetical protein
VNFPEGFRPPSAETIARVNNPDTFVVATWNGIPADNSGKREVRYLTDRIHARGTFNVWTTWRSNAQQFDTEEAATTARDNLLLIHLREIAVVYPNCEAHVMTGGIAGKELT